MAAKPCKECGVRPKEVGRHRCLVCRVRHEPIAEQVAERDRRRAMIPEELRRKRVPERLWPDGQRWCGGCQSFVDLEDIPKHASRCRACQSAATHGAMIEKTYGLTPAQYDELLRRQGGRCAICRQKPRSKRLAVDHDHGTGAVRGLLCSRCNHDLLGAAWDSIAKAEALVRYLRTPPTSGLWEPPETAAPLSPPEKPDPFSAPSSTISGSKPQNQISSVLDPISAGCRLPHYLPTGAESIPGKKGVWRYLVEPGADPPF